MTKPKIRCAIYTRKSTEDGLEMEFNSLDAQREACSAYIISQRSEGWVEIKDRFDDGGLSGATMNRPGLQALMEKIEAGQIDMIVVYKVDRLTRSLADFGRMVDRFDQYGVSFVSVTQSFNTSTSMGRLTLNMLLSFAQFEREVTAERIRDKILASRKKGMWTGGNPPLGYDIKDKALFINEMEAETVQQLFTLYRETRSVPRLKLIAASRGFLTKRHRNGRGGVPFGIGTLYALLSNPLYAGLMRAGDELVEGRHEAIIPKDEWEEIQEIMEANRRWSGSQNADPSPLIGKIYADGDLLTPVHTKKRTKKYRYYISSALVRRSEDPKSGWRLPALELERVIAELLLHHLDQAREAILQEARNKSAALIGKVTSMIATLKERLIAQRPDAILKEFDTVINKIEIEEGRLRLTLDLQALARLIDYPLPDQRALTIESPFTMKRRRYEQKIVLGNIIHPATPDEEWSKLFPMVLRWKSKLLSGETDLKSLAAEAGIDRGHASRLLPLAFPAPDIIIDLVEGRGPVDLTLDQLREVMATPKSWAEQRKELGMAS